MPVAYAAGFGESYPVDYARMDEFVGIHITNYRIGLFNLRNLS